MAGKCQGADNYEIAHEVKPGTYKKAEPKALPKTGAEAKLSADFQYDFQYDFQ